ncbi:MAG: hypothetical protein K0S55_996 [Clostridia bacterium]|nr:hypothetical protein [Clostridia bacterium]
MNDLTKMAEDLGEAIKQSNEYINYQKVKAAHDGDSELQMFIGEFNLKKMAVMQEMQKEPRNETRVEELQSEMRSVYANIMKNPIMTEYLEAKEAIESTVNNIYSIINFHVTGKEASDCGGSCASCGGGCSH